MKTVIYDSSDEDDVEVVQQSSTSQEVNNLVMDQPVKRQFTTSVSRMRNSNVVSSATTSRLQPS